MNVFSVKSIGLYSLAIGIAIGFFHLVTSYGEANIKAPISIAGKYVIAAPDLPGCLQHKALLMTIQQSGVYLNANLIIIDGLKGTDILQITDRSTSSSSTDIRPTFSGRLQDRQFDLSGLAPITTCPVPSQLRIAGSISNTNSATKIPRQRQLQGQLWLNSQNSNQTSPVDFTATLQPSTRSTRSH
jgi:hypothetical protein